MKPKLVFKYKPNCYVLLAFVQDEDTNEIRYSISFLYSDNENSGVEWNPRYKYMYHRHRTGTRYESILEKQWHPYFDEIEIGVCDSSRYWTGNRKLQENLMKNDFDEVFELLKEFHEREGCE